MKPLVLLDFDGTVALLGDVQIEHSVYRDGFEYMYRPALIEAINTWTELADVRWCTTWCDEIQYIKIPGLPELPWEERGDGTWWKASVPPRHPNRPLVWLDDHIASHRAAANRAVARDEDTLLLSPKQNEGVTDAMISRVTKFLLAHQ